MFAEQCEVRALLGKLNGKKAFTLVELLIVLAIVAIIAAVAIPAYSAQMEKARQRVDETNFREAQSLSVSQYLLDYPEGTDDEITYWGYYDKENQSLMVKEMFSSSGVGGGSTVRPDGYNQSYIETSSGNKMPPGFCYIEISVKDGKITKAEWLMSV